MSEVISEELYAILVERGALTRKEIGDLWSLSTEDWRRIRESVLRRRNVEPGPPRVGGLRIKKQRLLQDPDATVPESLLKYAWESEAVEGLCSVLTYDKLEKLLGPLAWTVRMSRVARTGQNRRGTRHEIATALMIRHGRDLFANQSIRRMVGKECQLSKDEIPTRWVPGKDTAISFVKKTGFPEELAGIPSAAKQPDYEYIEGRPNLGPLVDFQLELQAKVLTEVLQRPNSRRIASLPTGAGKTRVAVESLREWMSSKWSEDRIGKGTSVLWLAHTEELCEQAYECFKQVWEANVNTCPIVLFRFWGQYTQQLNQHAQALDNLKTSPCVLISTPQRIFNLLCDPSEPAKALRGDLRYGVGAIVVDEAHRAAAPTYRRILDDFEQHTKASVLGLTATPFRMSGTQELQTIFEAVLYPDNTFQNVDPKDYLQDRGYLARPRWREIETQTIMKLPDDISPSTLTEQEIGRIDDVLAIRADNARRRIIILDAILEIYSENQYAKVLYFGPSVFDAECMAYLLRERGIAAGFVSGGTRSVSRRRLIEEFKKGHVHALCNCEVLTTGFDAPQVTHLVMARPTVSPVLYEQMLGRGLRGTRFGGTELVEVYNCKDDERFELPMPGYKYFREMWASQAFTGGTL